MLSYKFLGSGGVCPLPNRQLTSLFVQCNTKKLLIDCGENVQTAAFQYNIPLFHIDAVFISHYHSDHVLGLAGMLTTLSNHGRKKPLIVFGPPGTKYHISTILKLITKPLFYVQPVELKSTDVVRLGEMRITPVVLQHSITCYGYSIEYAQMPKYDETVVEQEGFSSGTLTALQQGYTVEYENMLLNINNVFGDNRVCEKLVYATDTGYCDSLVRGLEGANVAILDGSYGDASQMPKTVDDIESIHMTFEQAARCAAEAGVKKLILTHFTPTLVTPAAYLKNATDIFKNTACAAGGMSGDILADEKALSVEPDTVVDVPPNELKRILASGSGAVSSKQLIGKSRNMCFLHAHEMPLVRVSIRETAYMRKHALCAYEDADEMMLFVQLVQVLPRLASKGA